MTTRGDTFHRLFHRRQQCVGETRVQVEHPALRDRGSLLAQRPIEARVEGDHRQGAVRGLILTRDRPPQCLPRHFREQIRIFGDGCLVGQGFDNRPKVADRNAFPQQIAEDADDRSKRQ